MQERLLATGSECSLSDCVESLIEIYRGPWCQRSKTTPNMPT